MNSLPVKCDVCKVAQTCPKKGSSPLVLRSKKQIFCQLVGGYGRVPVDQSILSEESRARSVSDGPCVTIAEVPQFDEGSGTVHIEVVKVFHAAVLHEREKTSFNQDMIYPKSHNG